MPIIPSTFAPPAALSGGNLQTVLGRLTKILPRPAYVGERIGTPDGDFLDLDWLCRGNGSLAIVTHGLEGSSDRPYVRALVHHFKALGWEILAWNFRGCSGEANLLPASYHSGLSADLKLVVQHGYARDYKRIVLIGFSVGGNITLKFLGEEGREASKFIERAVAISVPCDLEESAQVMALPSRSFYMRRFLRDFYVKFSEKAARFPDVISVAGFAYLKNFFDFDSRYTAPLHGFPDAITYWRYASSLYYLDQIAVPTLLINAIDDPFYGPRSIPTELAAEHSFLHLETPKTGGHVGFLSPLSLVTGGRSWWLAQRVAGFLGAA